MFLAALSPTHSTVDLKIPSVHAAAAAAPPPVAELLRTEKD